MVANLGHFKNVVTFRVLGVFWRGLFAKNNLNVVLEFFSHTFDNFNF